MSVNIFEERGWLQSNVLPYVEKSKILTRNPLKVNCRCPVCGDSKKNKHKARGYFLEGDEGLYYYCHRCGYSKPLGIMVKEVWPHLYRDWIFMRFKDSNITKEYSQEDEYRSKRVLNAPKPKENREVLEGLKSISELPETHPVRIYVERRKIPEKFWNDILYTDRWYHVARRVDSDVYPPEMDDRHFPRLVFPFRDKHGKIIGMQGRALRPRDMPKYITVKISDETPKIWGLDRIETFRPVPLMEGIVDSMFIDNSSAILGAVSHSLDDLIPKRTWVLDDEPDKPETVKHIGKLIDSGETVVIWDRIERVGKDINEKILNGQSPEELNQYILNNSVSGLRARLRFNQWKRV